MKLKTNIVIGFLSAILLTTTLVAEDAMVEVAVSSEEKADSGMGIFPNMEEVSGVNLENQRDEYLREKKRRLGFTSKGSYIGWGSASIEASPKSLDFGQKRIAAFEKAFTDAKAEFVQTKKQKIGVSLERKLFHDDRDAPTNQVKDGKALSIGKKLLAVTEAKLDKALIELGVDPSEIENSTIEEKRKKAENSFNREVSTTAIQNISGIRILATFEDTKGVGVLIVQSPAYAELARAIASRKLLAYPSPEDPIESIASKIDEKFYNKQALIPQYGIRLMNDDAGNRVLVSFGQWSPKVKSSDSKMKINMAIKAAKQIAYDNALAYMTQFINTTMAVNNKSAISDSNTLEDIMHSDGTVEMDQGTSSVGGMLDRFIKETSSATIEGVTSIKSWSTNHPDTGHPIVGNILVWSPVTQDFARQKPKPKPVAKTVKQKEHKVQNKTYQSVDLGDDDF